MSMQAAAEFEPRDITLSFDAFRVFQAACGDADAKARITSGLAAGWHGKTDGRLLRLAAAFEFLAWAVSPSATPAPKEISGESMARAATFGEYLGEMLKRAQVVMEEPYDPEEDAMALSQWILQERPAVINEVALARKVTGFWHLRRTERRSAAFKELENSGWIRRKPRPTGKKGPPTLDWEVNPAVYQGLDEEIAA